MLLHIFFDMFVVTFACFVSFNVHCLLATVQVVVVVV